LLDEYLPSDLVRIVWSYAHGKQHSLSSS
jgi:hypothetical protein